MMRNAVLHSGDCLEILGSLPENSIDSVVTDPPYELGFMGKGWDATGIANNPALWSEVLRVLKPGGHMVAFGGTRTCHRMVCAVEDAGFEVRDQFLWIHGQGFPKSRDVSKAIDKEAGAKRKAVGERELWGNNAKGGRGGQYANGCAGAADGSKKLLTITAHATAAALQWDGWGTAAKPAHEPICLARKPLSEKTVAANVLRWGTGALNIDGCRIEATDNSTKAFRHPGERDRSQYRTGTTGATIPTSLGRWPANLCHDGSPEVLAGFPETGKSPPVGSMGGGSNKHSIYGDFEGERHPNGFGDSGSAARFFYCAKASKADRAGSKHPTVKPVALMQWLCRLITPPGGTVLDPFAGSGTTGEAAWREGFHAILIEREAEYVADIRRRIDALATPAPSLPLFASTPA